MFEFVQFVNNVPERPRQGLYLCRDVVDDPLSGGGVDAISSGN